MKRALTDEQRIELYEQLRNAPRPIVYDIPECNSVYDELHSPEILKADIIFAGNKVRKIKDREWGANPQDIVTESQKQSIIDSAKKYYELNPLQ